MLRKALFILSILVFSGCGSTNSIQRGPDYSLPYGAKVGKINISLDSRRIDGDAYEAFQENSLSRKLRSEIRQELSERGLYSSGGELTLDVNVVKGRLRSAFSAAVLSGLTGSDKIHAIVTMRSKRGQILKNFESRSEFGSGGVLGTTKSSRIDLLADNLAEEIGGHFSS